MRVQNGKRICSNLTYSVRSTNQNETMHMVLAVDDNLSKIPGYFKMQWNKNDLQWNEHVKKLFLHDLTVPAYVTIHLLHCPIGFELSETGECDCSQFVAELVISCYIETMLITRKTPIWISYVNDSQDMVTISLSHI